MPSELIVKIQRIHSILAHPNADKLEIAIIGQKGGWQTCVKKNEFNVGDLVVFIPPDSLLPKSLHEFLGITKYCGEMPKDSQENIEGYRRVKAVKLRGCSSYGTLMTLTDFYRYLRNINGVFHDVYFEGHDVATLLGIKKFTPKEKVLDGDLAAPNSLFHKYTDIQNIRNYPDWLVDNEDVVILEKIHGKNCRLGVVRNNDGILEWCAGSHHTQRKERDCKGNTSAFWLHFTDDIKRVITDIYEYNLTNTLSVIVFGEIVGNGVQDLTYGFKNQTFRVFDIAVNGRYLDWQDVAKYCGLHNVETVPVLYIGPFSHRIVEQYTDGNTILSNIKQIREGCVVKPIKERINKLGQRVILKSVSVDYLSRKNATDN